MTPILSSHQPHSSRPYFCWTLYMKQKLSDLKGERFTIIATDIDTPFSVMNGTSRQKVSKDAEELSSTISQLGPTDIYRTLHLPSQILY